jgi:hypothetical protein
MARRWAKYALARCPPWAGNECELQSSRWIYAAGIQPHLFVKWRTVRRGLWGAMCRGQRVYGARISGGPMLG